MWGSLAFGALRQRILALDPAWAIPNLELQVAHDEAPPRHPPALLY